MWRRLGVSDTQQQHKHDCSCLLQVQEKDFKLCCHTKLLLQMYLTGVTYHMAEQCDEDSDDEGLMVRTMLRENVSNMKQLLMKNDWK